MFKKIAQTFSVLFITSLVLFACEKKEDDNENPTLEVIQPHAGDTIHLASNYVFEAIFQDNKGLSSYQIQILNPKIDKYKRIIANPDSTKKDSLIYLDEFIQKSNIFGIKDTAVTVKHTFSIDSLGYYRGRGPFEIVTGTYQFKVVVMDIDGNRDSTWFDIQVVPTLFESSK